MVPEQLPMVPFSGGDNKLFLFWNGCVSVYVQYLEDELFEEQQHESPERDDLLLGGPWSI
jgi:hypothetical protein